VTDVEVAAFRPLIPDWGLVEVDGIAWLRRVFRFDDFT
jgi:hypothetical protein